MKDYDRALDWYEDADQDAFREVLMALRPILLEAGLEETVKWGQPCYMDRNKNIALVGWMKGTAILSLLKGVMLEDPKGRFEQAGSNRSNRYLPYESVAQVEDEKEQIARWLQSAVELTRAGKKLPPRSDTIDYVPELRARMAEDPVFEEAFLALTPGRQRGFNHHFGQAKKSATRVSRIEANWHKIQAGKGFFECACGLSKRPPKCDGSHRSLAKG